MSSAKYQAEGSLQRLIQERDALEQRARAAEERLFDVEAERDLLESKLHEGKSKYNAMVEQCQEFDIQTGVLSSRLIEANKRVCALEAYVERQDALLAEHFEEWEADTGEWNEFDWHDRVAKCREEKPDTSLAHLKGQFRAEGAENVRDRLREKANMARTHCNQAAAAYYHRCANIAENKAGELRRQAGEVSE